jgi:hypothetical protein
MKVTSLELQRTVRTASTHPQTITRHEEDRCRRSGWNGILQSLAGRWVALWLLIGCSLGLSAQSKRPSSPTKPLAAATSDAWQLARSNPAALMQRASLNEMANSYAHRRLLRYRVRKVTAKSDTTKEIVETLDGGVARLIAERNAPLTVEQQQAEMARLRAVAADPEIQAHRRRHEMRDASHLSEIMRLLPTAFSYTYAGKQQTAEGTFIRLSFVPDPKFSPPDLMARVLTGIRGEAWIDPAQMRVVRITGRLFRHVNYGWGLLGVLDPGGTLSIVQTDTQAAGWQMSHLVLDLQGKAVLVKTLDLHVDETAWDHGTVPSDWHYRDAVEWLLQQNFSSVREPESLYAGGTSFATRPYD